MPRLLIFDGDVIAYKAAAAVEIALEWEPGYWTWHCDEQAVRRAVDDQIDFAMAALGGSSFKLCLTDAVDNFRKRILATYKIKRSNIKKPLVLSAIRYWLIEEKGAYIRPGLEGDDCMGILATMAGPEERVIVSVDKDMKTVPGLYSRDGESIEEISEQQADYWHMFQTLTGDQTDGYSGCPGIGPKKAEAILDHEDNKADPWAAVVRTYEKAGLSEEEALVQARVARILRASDYDFQKKEPILWTPR